MKKLIWLFFIIFKASLKSLEFNSKEWYLILKNWQWSHSFSTLAQLSLEFLSLFRIIFHFKDFRKRDFLERILKKNLSWAKNLRLQAERAKNIITNGGSIILISFLIITYTCIIFNYIVFCLQVPFLSKVPTKYRTPSSSQWWATTRTLQLASLNCKPLWM